jgi:hypothetical protein
MWVPWGRPKRTCAPRSDKVMVGGKEESGVRCSDGGVDIYDAVPKMTSSRSTSPKNASATHSPMTLPHPPKRIPSDTTHVSDSEASSESSVTSTPSAPHPVLSTITNKPPLRRTVEHRLANIERGLVEITKKLELQQPRDRSASCDCFTVLYH